MIFSVVGGDRRLLHLCSLLEADGHTVRRWALPGAADSLSAALAQADCVILPLPLCTEPCTLSTPLWEARLPLRTLLREIPPETLICAGRISDRERDMAHALGHHPVDYLKREELAVKNAVATAEGAMAILMDELPETLWGSRILVVGFGRIGKVLADRLGGMGAFVTVSSRKYSDMAMTEALGYHSLSTPALAGQLQDFDIVVNTVPAPVLGRALLAELKPGAFVLDLASAPGGVDFEAARELGVKTRWALSIPGKASPAAAGRAIRDTVYHIIKERQHG